ncbi:hypothetical protein [Streptomyces sp. NPDC055099]
MHIEERLLDALGTLGRDRVRHGSGPVAVARLADVVTVLGVDLESRPGLRQHLRDVPLRHSLLHAARKNLGRGVGPTLTAPEVDRLIRRHQRNPGLLQLVLDLRTEIGGAGNPIDRFTDDDIESSIRSLRLLQEVLHSAVARDGDREPLMGTAATAGLHSHAPGFHVVEVRDDRGVVG